MPPNYKYFTPQEVVGLDETFCAKLDLARAKTIALDPLGRGVPFIITSGFRSPEKNQSVIGAVPDSAHLKGLAVDLRVDNTHEVWAIITALNSVGVTRFGIYVDRDFLPVHVHCDCDPDKVQEVIFIKREADNGPIATV